MAASDPQAYEHTDNGNSTAFSHPGGRLVYVRHDDTGTSGTTKVQFMPDGQDNWQDLPNTTLTESDGLEILLPKGQVRDNLASHSGNSVWTYFSFFS